MKQDPIRATLLFLLKGNHILLAMKKRGFGANLYNGVGGKVDASETIEAAAIRECQEEISVTPARLEQVAQLEFTFAAEENESQAEMHVSVYTSKHWEGTPLETEEMAPEWFVLSEIPYDKMWEDDPYWLPVVLAGKKVRGYFAFDQEDNLLTSTVENIPDNSF